MRIWILSISLLATVCQPTLAADAACVKSFREVQVDYLLEIKNLQSMDNNVYYGGGVTGFAALGGCLVTVRSVLACGALLGVAVGGSYGYRLEILAKIKRLEDGQRAYAIYQALKREQWGVPVVQNMLIEWGIQISKEWPALSVFESQMESGAFCKGNKPRSWEELRAMVQKQID